MARKQKTAQRSRQSGQNKRPPKVELDLTPEQRKVWLAECQRRRKLRLPMPSVQEILEKYPTLF
jgi:hypothetical protein